MKVTWMAKKEPPSQAKPSKMSPSCIGRPKGVTVARGGTWRWRKEWGMGIFIHSTNLFHLPFIILMWLARPPSSYEWCDRWRWHINLHPFRPPIVIVFVIVIIFVIILPSTTCHPVSGDSFRRHRSKTWCFQLVDLHVGVSQFFGFIDLRCFAWTSSKRLAVFPKSRASTGHSSNSAASCATTLNMIFCVRYTKYH